MDTGGITYRRDQTSVGDYLYVDIAEDHPRWDEVVELTARHDIPCTQITTEFTKKELDIAGFLRLGTHWHVGYPMPDDDFGYRKYTYDLRGYCSSCALGKIQKMPFRIKREPQWGKRHFTQLYWVYDEFFVQPDIWEQYLKPFGITCRPVIHHKTNKELETVVQIEITELAESRLDTDAEGMEPQICDQCGQIKYCPFVRGFFPNFLKPENGTLFKTHEYFGSGGCAYRSVIISAELYRVIKDNKLKGLTFMPLAQ